MADWDLDSPLSTKWPQSIILPCWKKIEVRQRTQELTSPHPSKRDDRLSTVLGSQKSSPVVRTNPVTGWKSLFGAGHQIAAGWIDNVTETESEVIKAYCECSLLDILVPTINPLQPSSQIDCPESRPPSKVQMEPE